MKTFYGKPQVTAAVITYNGKKVIQKCIESLQSQTYKPNRIIVVDNASTDGTREFIKTNFPFVEIIDYPFNRGPNPARNLAIKEAKTELVLLVDDDAVFHDDCLKELVSAYQLFPDGAVFSPRILYFDKPDIIQFEGVSMHFISEAILLNGDTPINKGVSEITPIQIAGGVSYLVSKTKAISVGLFDEEYFFGRTDGEFTYRLTLAGYNLFTIPKAICYHRVKKRGLTKANYQIKNRWDIIFKTYDWKTILLLTPAFFVYELLLLLFLTINGSSKEYFKAVFSLAKSFPSIMSKRKSFQEIKTVNDRNVLKWSPINMRSDLLEKSIMRKGKNILDNFFYIYWKVVKGII
jgi:hypothetical protein